MFRRKLLTILFVCILLPVVITLVESASTMLSQKRAMTEIAGRYVRSLSEYASARWQEGNTERIAAFLSLIADRGYDGLLPAGGPVEFGAGRQEKFLPGLVAYVRSDGELISFSQNAGVLARVFERTPVISSGSAMYRGGTVTGSFRVGRQNVAYVAHVTPTRSNGVYAIAAVTMLSWMGQNDFNIMKLAYAGTASMIVCLCALFLLRGAVITPLRELSSEVEALDWGREMPRFEAVSGRRFGDIGVDEITSLKKAVTNLARRMIDKEELERRYMGDIVKAQESERGRLARDIHDGPIQVLSALIQRIQIANITSDGLAAEARQQLSSAEDVANDLVEELRDICDSLVPPWVSLGLASCMEEAASRLGRQNAIAIDMNVDSSIDVSQECTLALFRIFQEAVSNAVRHGGATSVSVDVERLTSPGRSIRMCIVDNGCGFDTTKTFSSDLRLEGKRGLAGMRQRVELLGGEYEIRSAPGEGSTIVVSF